jgi:photosystem II stability/assembly factor-like uncharacterized protein
MARTSDGGRTWIQAPAPPATVRSVPDPLSAFSVRFANQVDGWVYTTNPSRLWSTHDGGTSWHPVVLPGLTPEASILGMEAAGGRVYVAVVRDNAPTVHLEASPVASDAWRDTDSGVPAGAGPVPSTQVVLQRSRGWLLQNDRTVVGGFQLNAAGRWTAWTPPCQTANGTAALTASSPSNLVAVCSEGVWGPARNLPAGAGTGSPSTWLFQSSDGGGSFRAVGPVPLAPSAQQVVGSPAPSTVVVGGSGPGLYATFDGGHTWRTVYQDTGGSSWSYLGFTTLTQGVAITSTPSGPAALLMTRDGGHSWAPVSFARPG